MSIYLKDSDALEKCKIHYMPCKIHFDGEVNVSRYFTYNEEGEGNEELKTSFRGYPLLGKKISLPEGYRGRVFKEARRPNAENLSRHLQATHDFDSLIYWNWDQAPSKSDPFISALDWLHIAEAIHEDSDDE